MKSNVLLHLQFLNQKLSFGERNYSQSVLEMILWQFMQFWFCMYMQFKFITFSKFRKINTQPVKKNFNDALSLMMPSFGQPWVNEWQISSILPGKGKIIGLSSNFYWLWLHLLHTLKHSFKANLRAFYEQQFESIVL